MDTNNMERYSATCTGRITDEYTWDGIWFNKMLDEGYSLQEVVEKENKPQIVWFPKTMHGFHMIYTYEVDGKTYYRACAQSTHRRDRYFAIQEKKGIDFEVHYDPADPSQSYIGARTTQVSVADKLAWASFIIFLVSTAGSMFLLPGLILPVVSIVLGIIAMVKKTNKMVIAFSGILGSAIVLLTVVVIMLNLGLVGLVFILSMVGGQ